MPITYPLSLPANIFPENVHVLRHTVAAIAESPFTLVQQVYQWPGARWEIEVTLQAMAPAEAGQWTQFFFDLKGKVGTFNFDLTPHCPGLSPAPGTHVFRLIEDPGWDSRLAVDFGFTFRAVEAL
jgi:hypothetical protein